MAKSAAERAAEEIDELSTYDLYQRLASDMGCDAAIHRVNQQVAAIISREYQELEQAADEIACMSDCKEGAWFRLRSALAKVRGN